MKRDLSASKALRSLYTQAEAACDRKEWPQAIALLEDLIKQATGARLRAAYLLLIPAYRAIDRVDRAESAAATALQRFPDDARLLSQSAYNFKVAKRLPDQVRALKALLAIEGAQPNERTYRRLIGALRQQKHFAEAETVGAQALAAFPESAALLGELATVAGRQRDWALAVARLERMAAIEGSPSDKTQERLAEARRRLAAAGASGAMHGDADDDADDAQGDGDADASPARTLGKKVRRKVRSALWSLKLPVEAPPPATEPAAAAAFERDDWMARLDEPAPRRHPYQKLRPYFFWNRAVEHVYPLDITDWYRRKFSIDGLSVATAGSCFAQHIGRQLRHNGYTFVDTEPAPSILPRELWLEYGYGMYSARFGNVYTTRQLLQLLLRARGEFTPADQVWERDGGVVDPFRPTIEPEPFEDVAELEALRRHHLKAVLEMFQRADVFVFTLGLTEAWESLVDGAVFPVAPGVSGGRWDPSRYRLHNLDYSEVVGDMERFIALVREIKPTMRFLLTVSPVPLMATGTDHHVVVATTYSKSVLRAAAGALATKYDFVDYFPSFEIISAPAMRGQFYNADMRNVSSWGVEHVMRQFFSQHKPNVGAISATAANDGAEEDPDEVACDEELLRKFGAKAL